MTVCAAKWDAQPSFLELVCHRLSISDSLLLQLFELPGLGKLECKCQTCKHVNMGSALLAREDSFIDLLGDPRVGGEQHRPARTIKALMRGGHHHVGMSDRGRNHTRRNEPPDVRDIREEI